MKLSTLKNKAGVYALIRNREIFYVGVSSYLKGRLSAHMLNHGKDIEIEILEDFGCIRELSFKHYRLETFWIKKIRSQGFKLLNKNISKITYEDWIPEYKSIREAGITWGKDLNIVSKNTHLSLKTIKDHLTGTVIDESGNTLRVIFSEIRDIVKKRYPRAFSNKNNN